MVASTVEERIEAAVQRAKAAIHAECNHHHRAIGQRYRREMERWRRTTGRA